MGITIKMLSPEVFFLVTCMALATAIRVDFGTKQGPIVPPTPTTTVRPQPPFRDPAPVWEDQSDDIPNPNPYQYVLPPPSRPKPTTNTYQASRPSSARDFVFGSVVAPNEINSLFGSNTVASLSPQYVPNFGFKYNAVVPTKAKTYYSKSANVYYNDKLSKFNGKYNAKSKKYKAYEKVKYVPDVYYSNIAGLPALSFEQQLPSLQPPKPFRLPQAAQPVPTFNYGPSKVTYSKNDLYALSKNYKTHQPQKRHTLTYESMRTRR